jgi:hypothetical protein
MSLADNWYNGCETNIIVLKPNILYLCLKRLQFENK